MNLLFRTDGSRTMGTGHVMRCLALAQAWRDAGGHAVFVMAETTGGIQARIEAESCKVRAVSCAAGTEGDWVQTIVLARELAAEWIVVDGYQFNAEYQDALKAAGFKVLFLDDYGHATHYSADLVLNQNAYADEKLYTARESYTRFLLGPRYCLLRREFASWRGWKREITAIGKKVLVTMGGSDPDNFTATVIKGLLSLPNIEATVVVGGSNPHIENLQHMTAEHGGRFRLLTGVSNMPELMAQADLAVSGAGSTCWEMCLLQLPMALVDLADNQKPIACALDEMGAAIHLGSSKNVMANDVGERVVSLLASEAERAGLSERCGKLVDGRGTERVLGELTRG
jgi:UDP-2,4-diacetamido-2,4,6-trideoxy-beta-L-altropyranose hydrolase